MLTLFQHPMSAASRVVRIVLNEYDIVTHLIEEHEWARRREFLVLNPGGFVPVLLAEREIPLCGTFVICEYLDETRGALKHNQRFFPENPIARAEVRRLMHWCLYKFDNEITRHIVKERIFKREMPIEFGGGSPDSTVLRLARSNIKPHMSYLNWLLSSRDWLAGGELSYADFSAAAEISVLDYLDEIDWEAYASVREWYMRLKSRPSFRSILEDRIRGLTPSPQYRNLDF